MSIREASRVFGLHRDTVRKMLSHPVPPGYRRKRPPYRPKLEPYTGVIDGILEDDLSAPKKQRHTAKRIFERLRDEHGFDGGYTIVKDYVRERRRVVREMFVPLSHPPGHAQCDFGQAWATIGGEKRRIHYFVMSLPHSDGIFVKAYPGETTEAFCDGHVSAFRFLGGVPQSILYDNTKLAVREDTGRRTSQAHESVHGAAVALPVQRQVRAELARATTRAVSKAWWDTVEGTSWCRSLRSQASMRSTPTWRVSAWSVWTQGSGDTRRR